MRIRFARAKLKRLVEDAGFRMGFDEAVVKKYRHVVQLIVAARDERDIRAMKSLHLEKLKGKRSHEHSIRLKDQWRMILELQKDTDGRIVVIVDIEDYH